MHDAAMNYVAKAIQDHNLNRLGVHVLELGGRDVNGTVENLFFGCDRYISVDIVEGPGVDIVCDAADLNLRDKFDVVVSTELFEHTDRAAEIVGTARRHLKPGGTFVATMAGPGRLPHGASGEAKPPLGEWYMNVEKHTLEKWLEDAGFTEWVVDHLDVDMRCIARADG
jgi:SAM-dependent methyltransferase